MIEDGDGRVLAEDPADIQSFLVIATARIQEFRNGAIFGVIMVLLVALLWINLPTASLLSRWSTLIGALALFGLVSPCVSCFNEATDVGGMMSTAAFVLVLLSAMLELPSLRSQPALLYFAAVVFSIVPIVQTGFMFHYPKLCPFCIALGVFCMVRAVGLWMGTAKLPERQVLLGRPGATLLRSC